MDESVNYGTYEEKKLKFPFFKQFIAILIIVLIIVLFFLIRGCSMGSKEQNLLKASKQYLSQDSSKLPQNVGECTNISVNDLISKQLIKDASSYSQCNREETYVKVCKLESGNYQYTPFIKCNTKDDTNFTEFVEGEESNLVADKSDVRFAYLPEIYSNKVKLYYPNNNRNRDEVKEYYAESPAEGYTYKTKEKETGYKWYKEETGTTYWNNGGYSSEQPEGYPTKGEEGTSIVQISLTQPEAKDYRTINKQTVYRSRTATSAKPLSYVCKDNKLSGYISSPTKCENRNASSHKITAYIKYTCDGKNEVSEGKVCSYGSWSNWTTNQCTKSATVDCESSEGYVYKDRVWKWYLQGTHRKYYPSNAASAVEEKTYYISQPAEGYIKDENTKATVYKYYKLTDEENTESTNDGDWVQISDDYLTLDEMLQAFRELEFEVYSLTDINNNSDKIRYLLKLEYRNRR